ncbi:hypothetical protein BC628DRAFT_1322232, partial [Trametes gibbosa]
IASCGRAHSASGTEGRFVLVDPRRNDEVVRRFYWDCSWCSNKKKWLASEGSPVWGVYGWGAKLDSGAIGNITITAVYNP